MSTNVVMPQMGESVAEGTIIKWLKKPGDHIERDEPLFEITTDKVDAEIPSPAAGVLAKILAAENETVAVNTVVAIIDGQMPTEAADTAPRSPVGPAPRAEITSRVHPAPEVAQVPPIPANGAAGQVRPGVKLRSSPLVRRIAREHNVDLSRVKGTGLGGRISKKDILNFLEHRTPATAEIPAARPPAPGKSAVYGQTVTFSGPTHVTAMTPQRRLIAEHMIASKKTSAHVTTIFEVDMTSIVQTRERMADEFERSQGLKLTYTPFIARAAVEAIKQFPIFNSSVEGTNIIYKQVINLGIAVAIETGLIVPVIKHAEEKDFLGMARAVQDLASRARSKQLNVEEVQEGTFTLTNPGIFGSLFGTPIIHQPQVAILGVGVIEKRPVIRNDAIAISSMAYLMLTFDHRIIDGAVADQFMAYLKSILETWQEPLF
ncbi:MAG TPA: dihydrolipoamide acetyltransferase family protein [Terriglobia bacterium]|nr:dihydrolipoamide acetyltransferase family protein [Terriglobia bacterium]